MVSCRLFVIDVYPLRFGLFRIYRGLCQWRVGRRIFPSTWCLFVQVHSLTGKLGNAQSIVLACVKYLLVLDLNPVRFVFARLPSDTAKTPSPSSLAPIETGTHSSAALSPQHQP